MRKLFNDVEFHKNLNLYNKYKIVKNENPLLTHTFQFALNIMDYTDKLNDQKKYIIARQLMKSGTSIGANCREAQNSESKADFIHKLKIAAKESEETMYWLELCNASPNYPYSSKLILQCTQIQKLLNKIISTAKNNLKNSLNY